MPKVMPVPRRKRDRSDDLPVTFEKIAEVVQKAIKNLPLLRGHSLKRRGIYMVEPRHPVSKDAKTDLQRAYIRLVVDLDSFAGVDLTLSVTQNCMVVKLQRCN